VLEIIIGLDPERDRSEIERLGLKLFSTDYVDQELNPRYQAAGFEILERGVLAESECATLQTSWAKRLRDNKARTLIYIIAQATTVKTKASRL
jgi:hypothetical protein